MPPEDIIYDCNVDDLATLCRELRSLADRLEKRELAVEYGLVYVVERASKPTRVSVGIVSRLEIAL